MSIHVIYHDHCADGLAAALAAFLLHGDRAAYHAMSYDSPLPDLPTDADVYMLDFSVKRPVLLELATRVASVTILDHHKTAEAELAGIPEAVYADDDGMFPPAVPIVTRLWIHFDKSQSGCMLAWKHFHGGKPAPMMFHLLQDRDLWKFEYGDRTHQFHAYMSATATTIADYAKVFADSFTGGMPEILHAGSVLLKMRAQQVERMCENAFMAPFIDREGTTHNIAVCNAILMQSEVGHALLKKFPEAAFAGVYYAQSFTEEKWSLRAREGETDVSAIAAQFGGGGHRAAAGFVRKANLSI